MNKETAQRKSTFAQVYHSLCSFFETTPHGEVPTFQRTFNHKAIPTDNLEQLLSEIELKNKDLKAYRFVQENRNEFNDVEYHPSIKGKLTAYCSAQPIVEAYFDASKRLLLKLFSEEYIAIERETNQKKYAARIKLLERAAIIYKTLDPRDHDMQKRLEDCIAYRKQQLQGHRLDEQQMYKKERIRVKLDRRLIQIKQQYEMCGRYLSAERERSARESAENKVRVCAQRAEKIGVTLEKEQYIRVYFQINEEHTEYVQLRAA